MTKGLIRRHHSGNLHFVTFSCAKRRPYFAGVEARYLFENALERMRLRSGCFIHGYVVMPEHVHLLMSEPEEGTLAAAMKGLKLSVSLRRPERPFWMPRYYDFNVYTEGKRVEKLRYLHRNPVTRGLVRGPQDWAWSSYLHWSTGVEGTVEIESEWTARRRELAGGEAHVRESGRGAPGFGVG